MKRFFGTHFDMGVQQGALFAQRGYDLSYTVRKPALLKKQIAVYQKFYPEFLDELRGIAHGGGYDINTVFAYYLLPGLERYQAKKHKQACTIFGITNQHGSFVGRNYDWLPKTEDIFEVYKKEHATLFDFVGFSDMHPGTNEDIQKKQLSYNLVDAINEHGLFIGITYGYYDYCHPGLSWRDIARYIMERCATVTQALAVFKKLPLSHPKNFFIADRKGAMAVVEHTAKNYKVLYPENNILIQTNHYVDPDLARVDQVLKAKPTHNTFIRYYETLQALNARKEAFTQNDVIKVLGNIQTCTCQNSVNTKTIYTLALDMRRCSYRLYSNLFDGRTMKKIST